MNESLVGLRLVGTFFCLPYLVNMHHWPKVVLLVVSAADRDARPEQESPSTQVPQARTDLSLQEPF